MHEYFQGVMRAIRDGDKDPAIKFLAANSLWVEGDVEAAYADVCKTVFLSQVFPLGSADDINKWVSDNTEHMIQKILQYPVRNVSLSPHPRPPPAPHSSGPMRGCERIFSLLTHTLAPLLTTASWTLCDPQCHLLQGHMAEQV